MDSAGRVAVVKIVSPAQTALAIEIVFGRRKVQITDQDQPLSPALQAAVEALIKIVEEEDHARNNDYRGSQRAAHDSRLS